MSPSSPLIAVEEENRLIKGTNGLNNYRTGTGESNPGTLRSSGEGDHQVIHNQMLNPATTRGVKDLRN